jgi:hypothetical protein
MGRSVSYPSAAQVVTFNTLEPVDCPVCDGTGNNGCSGEEGEDTSCDRCQGSGKVEPDCDDFDCLIDDFRDHLRTLFPSVVSADEWIDREDHVLAENKLARFGMSEYCGLVAYWIVPQDHYTPRGARFTWYDAPPLAERWIKSIADKFVAAFGELTKVGSMSNGEGVYRRIDKA